ncbi:MAG: LamG domain-containing protein [Candidatus Latescibacterota bacterium]
MMRVLVVLVAVFAIAMCFNSSGEAQSTVAYYHLEGNGTDASGNGNDLVIKSDRVTWVPGKTGQAALMGTNPWSGSCFNSDGSAMTAPGSGVTYPGNGDWTVEAWVNVPDLTRTRFIVSHYSEHWAGHDPYHLMIIPDGICRFQLSSGSGDEWVDSAPLIQINKWYHVAGVYRYNQSMQVYINGEKVGEKAVSIVPEYLPYFNAGIGGNFCDTSTGLMVDEVRISHAALEPNQFIGWPFSADMDISELIEDIIADPDITSGLENALTQKLNNAKAALDEGDEDEALGLLQAFINQVNAQRGKKLSIEDADRLLDAAQEIIALIGSGVAKPAMANKLPGYFALFQNSPNPFNPTTTIEYMIPSGGSRQVTLIVYDLRGTVVRNLVNRNQLPGKYTITWNGTDDSGNRVSSGMYIYRIKAGAFSEARKMMMVR